MMFGSRLSAVVRGALLLLLGVAALQLTGCGSFFQCEGKASCGTSGSGTGSSSGDYAYVSNGTNGSTYLNEYEVSSGKLTTISGSPVNLTYTPSAMAVAPGNKYMYIAQLGTGLIYEYAIGSNGDLTIANSGNFVATEPTGYSSMDVSPDGNFLFALDNTGLLLYQFQIAPSSGLLSGAVTFGVSSSGTAIPQSVSVSPNKNYVACALGTNGTIVFPYSASSGITSQSFASLTTGSTASGDFGVVMDTNNYLYVARTTGPAVYLLTTPSAGAVTATFISQSSLTSGAGPHSIALNSPSGSAVYVGNLTDGTVSGYASSSGKLTNISGSPFPGPYAVSALARENSGKYLVAAGYNSSSGVQIYTIGSGGTLTAGGVAGTGTSTAVPALIAVTH